MTRNAISPRLAISTFLNMYSSCLVSQQRYDDVCQPSVRLWAQKDSVSAHLDKWAMGQSVPHSVSRFWRAIKWRPVPWREHGVRGRRRAPCWRVGAITAYRNGREQHE